MRSALSLLVAAIISGVSASNVLDLSSPSTFESSIGQGTPALVEL